MADSQPKRSRKRFPCTCGLCDGGDYDRRTIARHMARAVARERALVITQPSQTKKGFRWCVCLKCFGGKEIRKQTYYNHQKRVTSASSQAIVQAVTKGTADIETDKESDSNTSLNPSCQALDYEPIDSFNIWDDSMEIDAEVPPDPTPSDQTVELERARQLLSLQELMYREAEEADQEHQVFLNNLVDERHIREDNEQVEGADNSDIESSDDGREDVALVEEADDDFDIPDGKYYNPAETIVLIFHYRSY